MKRACFSEKNYRKCVNLHSMIEDLKNIYRRSDDVEGEEFREQNAIRSSASSKDAELRRAVQAGSVWPILGNYPLLISFYYLCKNVFTILRSPASCSQLGQKTARVATCKDLIQSKTPSRFFLLPFVRSIVACYDFYEARDERFIL